VGVHVRIQESDFDPGAEIEAMRSPTAGAVVSFVGQARGSSGGRMVASLFLEHYPGMTEAALERIGAQAVARWGLAEARIVHRVGEVPAGGRIVFAAASSAHRAQAFAACAFLVDHLKTDAPFWKQERGVDGAHWVEARGEDEAARDRWRDRARDGEPERGGGQ